MKSQPPVVDQLYARRLDSGRLIRIFVRECQVVRAEPHALALTTIAEARHRLERQLGQPRSADRRGLSFGLSGFQFWSQDTGGLLGQPDGALLIRWLQAGLILSHARIHGMGDRELYKSMSR
jgi:hypothetical protein